MEPVGVRGLVFHTVLTDESERNSDAILPHQALTLQQYRALFERLVYKGYTFIALSDLGSIDTHTGLFACVTFDDGYFNNLRILPLLEEFGIPMHIFVTTENVAQNRKYWWDVVYAEQMKRGAPVSSILSQIAYFKSLTPMEIERQGSAKWGEESWIPSGDLDRPLTPSELKEVSEHPLVTIGNHTHRHAIATNLSIPMFEEELEVSQNYLERILGRAVKGFAFPNGNWSTKYLKICQKYGFEFGFGCDERLLAHYDEIEEMERFRLGRFSISASRSMTWQADIVRATHSLDRGVRRWWLAQKKS